jgi:hypothetical protein
MNQGSPPAPGSSGFRPDGPDPYQRLGVEPDASFDAVQAARTARLADVGEDPLARSAIEAAYDAVLMDRLKERQQGKVSSAARTASQREQAAPPPSRPVLPSLPSLPQLPAGRGTVVRPTLPTLALAEGRERWFPLAAHGALLVLLVALPGLPADLLLALATSATVLNLQRRHGRFLAAVGWSVLLLVLGLVVGALLLSALAPALPPALPLTPVQIEAVPALLLLLLGALFLA